MAIRPIPPGKGAKRSWALVATVAIACAGGEPNRGQLDPFLSEPPAEIINKPYTKASLSKSVPEEARACFEDPATQAYLTDLHHRIMEHWHVPQDTTAYDIATTVTLHESGAVGAFRIVGGARPAEAKQLIKAVQTAQPFPPLEGVASCLSRYPLHMRFRADVREDR
jgi:hypothetical protein